MNGGTECQHTTGLVSMPSKRSTVPPLDRSTAPRSTVPPLRRSTVKRIGVIGSLVWDVIYGRDSRGVAVEEWGGIGYALSGLDAALADDWEIVPLIKVGHDLSARATQFVSQLKHLARDAALIEVLVPNNRVELRYFDDEPRSESMSRRVPALTWL